MIPSFQILKTEFPFFNFFIADLKHISVSCLIWQNLYINPLAPDVH